MIGLKQSGGPRLLSTILTVLFVFSACFIPSETSFAKKQESGFIPESFTNLAEMVGPAVVNIRTVKTVKSSAPQFRNFQRGPFGQEDPFRDFFDRFFGEEFQREFKQRSLGSGFVIDKEGYIVTNNHVIENADEIIIKMSNEEELKAEIVGRDPNTDLALLKVKALNNILPVKLGNSDDLKVGQWVVAIGSPFGLERTVTAGIVSAKGRVIGSGPYDDFVQTDASINPGNSGGPLINMDGEVVGINTAIIAAGQGIGFAIPINLASKVIDQLKASGEVTRGWLGVAIQDLSQEMAEYYGMEKHEGVIVAKVFKGDPADKAGIKEQDIIVEVNGKKIDSTRALTGMIADLKVGQNVDIGVLRNGERKDVSVTIAKRDEEKVVSTETLPPSQEEELGMKVSEISPEMSQRFSIPDAKGIIVTEVQQGSKAENAGVQPGDIIKEINHKPVNTLREFSDMIGGIGPGESINLFIQRSTGFTVAKITK
jgi:serine protease Do